MVLNYAQMLPRIAYVVTTSCGCLIIDLIVFYISINKLSKYVFNNKKKASIMVIRVNSVRFESRRVKLTIYPTPKLDSVKMSHIGPLQTGGALIGFEHLPFP